LGGVLGRLAILIAAVSVAAALLGGCGGSSSSSSSSGGTEGGAGGTTSGGSTSSGENAPPGASVQVCAITVGGFEALRATGVPCEAAQQLAVAWRRSAACEPAAGASRSSCTVRTYRCLTTNTAHGYTVGCSQPGRSVAFVVRKR
jgi:hypothetical protein